MTPDAFQPVFELALRAWFVAASGTLAFYGLIGTLTVIYVWWITRK